MRPHPTRFELPALLKRKGNDQPSGLQIPTRFCGPFYDDLAPEDFRAVQAKIRKRGLRWLLRQGHLDDIAVHTLDGRMELTLTPLELLDRLARLVTPPRIHKHRYCGVLAPNAKLRHQVIESAGPAGATLQVLHKAQEMMGMGEAGDFTCQVPAAGRDGRQRS